MDLRTYVGNNAAPQLDFNALKKKRRQIQRDRRKSNESAPRGSVEGEQVAEQLGVIKPQSGHGSLNGSAIKNGGSQVSMNQRSAENVGSVPTPQVSYNQRSAENVASAAAPRNSSGAEEQPDSMPNSHKLEKGGTGDNLGWSVDEALLHSRRKQEELVTLEKKSVRGCLCFRRPDFEHINEEKAKEMAERLQEEVSRDHSRKIHTVSGRQANRIRGRFRVSQVGDGVGMKLSVNPDETPVLKFDSAPSSPSCLKKDGGRRNTAVASNGRVRLHFVEGDNPKIVDFSHSIADASGARKPSIRLLLDEGEDPDTIKRQGASSTSGVKRGSTGSVSQPQSQPPGAAQLSPPPPPNPQRRRSRTGSLADVRSPIAEKLEALAGNHWVADRPQVPSTFSGVSQLETIREDGSQKQPVRQRAADRATSPQPSAESAEERKGPAPPAVTTDSSDEVDESQINWI